MFALFFNLYASMITGSWMQFSNVEITNFMQPVLNGIGSFLTSMFNNVDTPMLTLGDILTGRSFGEIYSVQNWVVLVAFILALITSIGVVVMAVKGVKKAFGIFFGHIR